MVAVCVTVQVPSPATGWTLTQVWAVPKVLPLVPAQVAPRSALWNTPAPAIATYIEPACAGLGSPARSNASPAGRPDTPSPDSLKNVAPPSVLRHTPPWTRTVAADTPAACANVVGFDRVRAYGPAPATAATVTVSALAAETSISRTSPTFGAAPEVTV